MFRRRNDTDTAVAGSPAAPADGSTVITTGKGRPTPTRREAEAAAKARAKAPRTRKEQAAAKRRVRADEAQKVRTAMKTGDERHLLPRDKGPVRRFVRDYVDHRFSFLEIVLPLVLVTTVLTYSGSPALVRIGSTVMVAVLALIVMDVLTLRFRLRRELAKRFEGESVKGTTWYAVSRSMQMRFMRLPKSQVKIGEKLPERYR
ncbi:DUF3043 domain-containing protein [Nocardioides sp. AX2bis]|uniref:DUF3043 domain-containing protein n=1 Tax=Nocardioides sp. AX2bis TaxID=2653157 RepID=UPI0012F4064E|nr:DUF3043 domain-containing protein [Nocardioides sp. AX2bis]VXB74403.1 conserved hypothetical protein [Nocardioides sp. AX2bis]